MPAYSFRSLSPVVGPGSFVHPTASLIGDVVIGANCYIGPGASLRGDFGRIILEDGANVQDNCVMHCFPDAECRVESRGHIGHGAILHGCRVGRDALIGMSSVVMDGVTIGEGAIIGALSFIRARFEIPARMLAMGNPVRIVRAVSDAELERKARGTDRYIALAAESLATMRPL